MKLTQFTALRSVRNTLAIGAAALALGVFTPACNKSADSKKQTAAPAAPGNAAVASANAKVAIAATAKVGTVPSAGEMAAKAPERAAGAPDLGITKTLKGASNVAIAVPGTQPVAAKAGVAADKAMPAGKGSSKVTSTHIVQVSPPASVASGAQGVVKVTLSPTPGWKINMDFPTSLKITAPSGVTIEKTKLRKADAAMFKKDKAEFLVKFSSTSPGPKAFSAKFKFAMCTDATCDPKKEMLAWTVDVK